MLYDSSLKRKWDNKNVLDYAIKKAKNEGIVEGESKGKLKGIIEVAAEMKREGITIAQIAKITKLAITEIEKL